VERDVLWRTREEPGLEHLRFRRTPRGVRADGLTIGVFDAPPRPFRLRYRVACDAACQVREVALHVTHPWSRRLALHADGQGTWRTAAGDELAEFRGRIDVDIMTSPFTNYLPVRRLPWAPGRSAEIDLVYVVVPELDLQAHRQRYTCLEETPNGAVFRFESLTTGFSADVRVDGDGLVTDYGDIWERVDPGAR
jgi:hypothetical protein